MSGQDVKVWDPLVRAFHWSLVLAFTIAFMSGGEVQWLHVGAGYTIAGLLLFRLAWGVIGTRHARFASFVHHPRVVVDYLKDILAFRPRRYLGHNPAGGAMVVVLLLSLIVTVLTGLAAYGGREMAGPLAGLMAGVGRSGTHFVKEIHEFFASFTLTLVVVHVLGVLLASVQHGENLIRAMIHGRKRVTE